LKEMDRWIERDRERERERESVRAVPRAGTWIWKDCSRFHRPLDNCNDENHENDEQERPQ
jgi:hypothetical protein